MVGYTMLSRHLYAKLHEHSSLEEAGICVALAAEEGNANTTIVKSVTVCS